MYNKHECNTHQELMGLLHICVADISFSFTALCCVKGRYGRHLEILTSNQKSDSVSQCIFMRRIFNLKQWRLGLFSRGQPNKNNKMSSDIRSVPDQKISNEELSV